jgi:AcrR family transcriptional regulator
VSELSNSPGRRQRADARRSVAVIVDAAVVLLGRKPDAAMEDIAAAAGVTRQTVYAHFPSRRALIDAVIDRITAEVSAALDAIDATDASPTTALERWLTTSWELLERYPVLLTPLVPEAPAEQDLARHAPIIGGLISIIRRGQRAGEFDRRLSPTWLVSATIALGHAAGQEVAAGRMSRRQAGITFRTSVLRVCGASAPSS